MLVIIKNTKTRFVGQLCEYHDSLALDIWKAENSLLPIRHQKKTQVFLNETIKTQKELFSKGNITINEYISQAIFWVCRASSKKLVQIWENQKPAEDIAFLDRSISNN